MLKSSSQSTKDCFFFAIPTLHHSDAYCYGSNGVIDPLTLSVAQRILKTQKENRVVNDKYSVPLDLSGGLGVEALLNGVRTVQESQWGKKPTAVKISRDFPNAPTEVDGIPVELISSDPRRIEVEFLQVQSRQ